MKPRLFGWPMAAAALWVVCTSAQALTNPPIRTAQGIEYMCGGKSSDEAAFMRMVSPRWAATLEFAVNRAKPGEVPEEVTVVVRERYTGRPVMEAVANAPYMGARLDPGAYEIEATMGGLTLRQPLVVFSGVGSRAAFIWPSNVDYANAWNWRTPEHQAAARTSD